MSRNRSGRKRNRKNAVAHQVSGLDLESKRLANRKANAEIDKIEAETEMLHKQFRLAVFRMIVASGGVIATLATILKAIFGV